MGLRALILASATFCVTALPAQGLCADEGPEGPHYSAAYDRCIDSTNGGDYALRECEAAELKRQEAAMTAVLADLNKRVSPLSKGFLVNAQRTWTAYRKEQCSYEAAFEAGGTMAELLADSCWTRMTYDRATQLRHFLDLEVQYGEEPAKGAASRR